MARKDITDLDVLRAYSDAAQWRKYTLKYRHMVWPEDLLAQRTGQPVKVCLRAMERAAARGYIEWGVSLRSGWLTPKGEQLLSEGGHYPSRPAIDSVDSL